MTNHDSTQGPDTPDSPRDDTLADEVVEDQTRPFPTTAAPTTTWAPAPGATATATAVRPDTAAPAASPVPPREYVKGPAPFAIVLGLLGLVVAAVTLFSEVVGFDVPWDDLGPWTVHETPDPAGEFLCSLDVVDALDARLCLPEIGRAHV